MTGRHTSGRLRAAVVALTIGICAIGGGPLGAQASAPANLTPASAAPAAEPSVLLLQVTPLAEPQERDHMVFRVGVSMDFVRPPLAAVYKMSTPRGALVIRVVPESPAAAAGILAGDIILRFGDHVIDGPEGLKHAVEAEPPGVTEFEVIRIGKGPRDLIALLDSSAVEVAPGRRSELLWFVRALAEAGDGRAAVRLSGMYCRGPQDAIDTTEATRWALAAQAAGEPAAHSAIGALYWNGCYRDGTSAVRDDAKAVANFREAAARGVAASYLFLAYAHELGRGAPIDLPMAADWYQRSIAATGSPAAMVRLAHLYEDGLGVRQNLPEATRLFEAAAAAGDFAGSYGVAMLYRNGRYWDGARTVGDDAKAVAIFRLAAERGDANGYLQLGYAYDAGRGVPTDHAAATANFRAAAERNVAESYYYLGLAYDLGRGVATDQPAAAVWYQRSISATGSPAAMVNLGRLYLPGQGVARNYEAARQLFERALAAGDKSARVDLGRLYLNGLGTLESPRRAETLFREASADGDAEAMYLLATILSRSPKPGSRKQAVDWFEKSYAGGYVAADYWLAVGYASWKEVAPAYDKAAAYLVQAIGRGDVRAVGDIKQNWQQWPRQVLVAVQGLLRREGYYRGLSDGVVGPMTLEAIDALATGAKK